MHSKSIQLIFHKRRKTKSLASSGVGAVSRYCAWSEAVLATVLVVGMLAIPKKKSAVE